MVAYLASPYTNDDEKVREQRFEDTSHALAWFMSNGSFVYSPIAMTHHAACLADLPKSYEFWHEFNCAMINRCNELWILCLPGWADSKGIKAEVKYAFQTQKKIRFFDWNPVDKNCLERQCELA